MNGLTLSTVGNLTRDPELRFTPAGQPVCQFTVAVTPRIRKGDQWTDGQTEFLDCQAWGLLAENVAESLARGTRVIVAGTLKTERWQDRDGQDRQRQRLTVDAVGPDLRYATARVAKTARQSTDQGQPAAPEGDPWATAEGAVRSQLGGRDVQPTDAPF